MIRIAKTKYGQVKGLPAADPRITSFKGIPFAAPPEGANRWRKPQPLAPWEGVLEAYDFGPISVQDTPGLGTDIYCREWHVDPEIPMDEDCLYLNVWTPAKDPSEKLPVLVWFFGGGFQWGYTAEMEFDGERIARRGVIVVSVNYRLAALGFMAHPDITKESPEAPGNFGHLDQQAGLKWVKENIAAFGGDPDQITIAGQSAGGGSVLAQLASKSNEGLFQRAVIFSGMIRDPYRDDPIIKPVSLAEGEKKGVEFLDFLGVKSIDEARKIDALTIREKYAEFVTNHPRMAPIVDGQFTTDDPYSIFVRGESLNIPVMAGNTSDEFFADNGTEDSRVSVIEMSVKNAFLRRSDKLSNNENTYYYCFDPDIPGWDNPGTFHSVDLWFWFETLAKCWRPFVGRHFDLARKMCNYFTNFIKSGDPNGMDANGVQMPVWKPYRRYDRNEMRFLADGPMTMIDNKDKVLEISKMMGSRKQGCNPYMPSWEYVPDGEPHVFGDRVYVYGSHDFSKGDVFCMGDYICYSAPVDDLTDWRYEGVIYPKTSDALNSDGHMCLYAPDVTVGPDGRYYLYYVFDKVNVVSVAVCDEPAGRYKFHGYVHYEDGTLLGNKEGDEPQFDPAVITEGEKTYLYTGFCGQMDESRTGAMCTVLGPDMLTIMQAPKFIVPGRMHSFGTEFEKHAFFEAPSIRKVNGKYYFIYSSEVMHELAYAVSEKPDSDFHYMGVIVSNIDKHIGTYKDAESPAAFASNNHGGIEKIGEDWYIFYHRHTNSTWFSRQGCAEKIKVNADGTIPQVEMTSSGLNNGPLLCTEEYPAYIVCNMFSPEPTQDLMGCQPRCVQDGLDGEATPQYVANISDGYTLGYKYFDMKGVKGMYMIVKGYCYGEFEIRTELNGEVIGHLKPVSANVWTRFDAEFDIPDGVKALYFTFVGGGNVALKCFGFK